MQYSYTAYELQRGVGIGWDIVGLDEKRLQALLAKPWTTDNRTFRDRCWTNKQRLVDCVQKELIQGMLRGDDARRITERIRKQFQVSRYQAARLVHTETTYFNAVSAKEGYRDLQVESVEIIETLDGRTCAVCGEMDGKIIPLSQFEPGVTVPPYHPNCRGTTAPAIDEKYAGERAARGKDGKTYYVPGDMKYSEWKKAFVDGEKGELTEVDDGGIIRLTTTEQNALNEYLSSGSYKINAALRAGENLTDGQINFVRQLDVAFGKMPIYDGLVYRSITEFGIEDLDAFWAKHIPGAKIRFPAYTSGGTEVYDDSFPIQYVIKSRNGRDIRSFNQKELEIVFPRNTEFRVVKVEGQTIYMEEL